LKQSNSSKKIESSKINKSDNTNRGVEFILNGRKKKKDTNTFQIKFPGGRKMAIDTEIILSLLLPVSLLFLIVGSLVGWVARDYMMNYREIPRPHPEMFDENGNLVPDEVIAFRFETDYDNNEEDDD
jgi:hypothetical protein